MPEIDALNGRFARSSGVAFDVSQLGGPVARLKFGGHEAVIALRGAQVLSWRPAGQDEALWLSPVARLDGEKAVRGGIPVCWPWFGPHPKDPTASAHGFVRTQMWDVVATEASAGSSRLTLAFEAGLEMIHAWRGHARLALTVDLGERLALSLATENRGTTPLELSEALHTYFAVGEIARVSVRGLEGHDYIDKLDRDLEKPQGGPILIDREVDRIYLGPAPKITIEDRSLARRIAIRSEGSGATIVWNPWIDKAARLGDMGADGWRRMLCIETANAGPRMVTLAPGARHEMSASYAFEPFVP